jgi:hypothetical protein
MSAALATRTRAPAAPPTSRWVKIDRLRESARRLLEAVEREFGRSSAFYGQCEGAWRRAEREAVVSIIHSDFKNAATLLDLAVHRLARGREVARRAELSPEDLAALLRVL